MNRLTSPDKRAKKVDLSKLQPDQFVALSGAIGTQVTAAVAEVKNKLQEMLDIYGLELVIKYTIVPKQDQPMQDADQAK
jgi:hypothetical protein